MSLTIPQVKQEIKELKEQKREIERKVKALEDFLGTQGNGTSSASARGGVDIRPTVRKVFEANGNEPLQVKDIVEAVAQIHQDVDKDIINRKMFNVIRKMLEKEGYGKYRLKQAGSGRSAEVIT